MYEKRLKLVKAKGNLSNSGLPSSESAAAKQKPGIGNQAMLGLLGGGMSVKDRARFFEAGAMKSKSSESVPMSSNGGKSIKERVKLFETAAKKPVSANKPKPALKENAANPEIVAPLIKANMPNEGVSTSDTKQEYLSKYRTRSLLNKTNDYLTEVFGSEKFAKALRDTEDKNHLLRMEDFFDRSNLHDLREIIRKAAPNESYCNALLLNLISKGPENEDDILGFWYLARESGVKDLTSLSEYTTHILKERGLDKDPFPSWTKKRDKGPVKRFLQINNDAQTMKENGMGGESAKDLSEKLRYIISEFRRPQDIMEAVNAICLLEGYKSPFRKDKD